MLFQAVVSALDTFTPLSHCPHLKIFIHYTYSKYISIYINILTGKKSLIYLYLGTCLEPVTQPLSNGFATTLDTH